MSGERATAHPAFTEHTARSDALALVRRLQRERSHRDARGLFFIEGIRCFLRTVECGWFIERLLVSDVLLKHGETRRLVQRLRRDGVPSVDVSPEVYRSFSETPHASGVAAIVRQRVHRLHDLKPERSLCWLVVQQMRSPGNLGTLLRSSAAVGGAGLIVVGGQVDPFDPALVRASMGAFFGQRIARTSVRQLGNWVRRHRVRVVGATPDAPTTHFEARFRCPALLVVGEERSGLHDDLVPLCDHFVRIPMQPGVDSLNVAVAGSLLMYEMLRHQRRR